MARNRGQISAVTCCTCRFDQNKGKRLVRWGALGAQARPRPAKMPLPAPHKKAHETTRKGSIGPLETLQNIGDKIKKKKLRSGEVVPQATPLEPKPVKTKRAEDLKKKTNLK